MTTKGKQNVRLYETEIERSREESNWKKVIELAYQLRAKSITHESLANFLIGEGKLEAYLQEWPPTKENIERAERELGEARGFLTLATDESGRRAGVALDAHLLLGKLHYACGAFENALKNFNLAELQGLTEKELPIRSLRIVAESFAIKGLCLEQIAIPASSRFKQAEREAEMIRSYELAADLTLLYLQKTNDANIRAGPTLETALQRVPILHMRAGRINHALDKYREMLRAVETPSTRDLRLTLTRQLAEVLLRAASVQAYGVSEKQANGGPSVPLYKKDADSPWKPKRYSNLHQFVPSNLAEEVVLAVLMGEAMAVRDTVLSQSAEFERARTHAHAAAAHMYDLLALATARHRLVPLLLESLERAMKFSYGCAHVWRQRALAAASAAHAQPPRNMAAGLGAGPTDIHDAQVRTQPWAACAEAGPGARAMPVMREAVALAPADVALRLVGAKTCYSSLEIDEGIQLSEDAVKIAEKLDSPLKGRCYLFAGIGFHLKARRTNARRDAVAWRERALQLVRRAAQLDANDHLALYYLALQLAHCNMLNEAMEACSACVRAAWWHAGALRLSAVLASRGPGGVARALPPAALARHHHPACEWLAHALADVHIHRRRYDDAFQVGRELLARCQSETDSELEGDAAPYAELDALSDTTSHRGATAGGASGGGGGVAGAGGVSLGASSVSWPRARTTHAPRARAWLLLAHISLMAGEENAAAGCVAEAVTLAPHHYLTLYMRGRVAAAGGRWEEARQHYVESLALAPTHSDALLHVAHAHLQLACPRLAEKCMREACALEPGRAALWRGLGVVLGALQQHDACADCLCAALELDVTAPAPPLSLYTLPPLYQ